MSPQQTTEYWMPEEGELLSRADGGSPLRLSEQDVLALLRSNTRGLPVGFLLEMVRSESNFAWNEVDTDYDEDGEAREQKTYGLCQLRLSEFTGALSLGAVSDEAACEPGSNVGAFSRIMGNYAAVVDTLAPSAPAYDRLCYLAWAHNNGIGAVTKSITNYGLDWQALKDRPQNSYVSDRLVPYAERAAGGASTYPELGSSSDSTLLRMVILLTVGWFAYQHFLRA